MANATSIANSLSVENVLAASRKTGEWYLPVTQRAFEWNRNQVSALADSVLLGFPIGSLLIATHDSDYYLFDPAEKVRKRVEGKKHRDLILDGQQRCTALMIAFDGDPFPDRGQRQGLHLWINVLERDPKFSDFPEMFVSKYRYFWHQMPERKNADGGVNTGLNNLKKKERKMIGLGHNQPRRGWLPLDILYKMSGTDSIRKLAAAAELKQNDSLEVLEDIVQRIKLAKRRCNVPVLQLEPEQHDDALTHLHQVFIRINTGGSQLSPLDIFFAGVKKFWTDAEEHVATIVDMGHGLLNRKSAITLIARCAAKTLDEDRNPTRLDAQLLSAFSTKDGNNKLVSRMREITPDSGSSQFERSVDQVCGLLRSKLHSGADHLYQEAIAAAIGWNMAHVEATGKKAIPVHSQKAIIGFTFWTAFYSVKKGRDRFGRRTFALAWKAGQSGEPFPRFITDKMWEVCFEHQMVKEHLPVSLPKIIALEKRENDKDTNQWLIEKGLRSARALSLGVFQKLEHSPIDWDHIIADNFGREMLRDRHGLHKATYWLGSTANFAGIDSRANRVLQDRPPSRKLSNTQEESYKNRSFICTDPNLLEEEEKILKKIERLLEKRKMDSAHRQMRNFVEQRSQRIWTELIRVAGKPPLRKDED